ncbi:IS66 family insertion sequence element accessory protein TnpB [Paraburkholderia sp. SG-MS1]|uniref:IS66 family insertion sequence element accessory protein TnpB n=1 Tax=Paraburkholderia sp. SG-MS1 TaxID=2023741 RepID=UPI00406C3B60
MHSTCLAAKVQIVLERDPFCGHVFVFRDKRGDLLKVLWWSSHGMCLLVKRLEKGRFVWPQADGGVICLSPAHYRCCWKQSGHGSSGGHLPIDLPARHVRPDVH